jgi:hypothetical protein
MLAICATDGEPALLGEVAAAGRQPIPVHDTLFSDVRGILARDGYFLAKSVFAREKVARWRSLTEEHFAFFPGAASEFLAEQNPELSWLTELLYEDRFAALLQSVGGDRNLTTSFDMLLNYNLATSPKVVPSLNPLRPLVPVCQALWHQRG